ncbi:hypothetical protein LOK74_00910 [Brevibacillus humidisoli]|uniref:hypothetical protein n=1 Tax=Brevibacillus humidisoli TaxID=2895522 RepID=UPI001E2E1D82|nr:hypothetical protein [Brevibacillus humidisoli]UFJ41155.1 hypothetical protein LOK74_00910 [Brevibacillus humidisoli]
MLYQWFTGEPIDHNWNSTVPMVCERILIYVIGALLVAGGGDGTMEGITVIQFIRGEAAPYYTVTYILLGLASPLLAIAAAGWRTNKTATA